MKLALPNVVTRVAGRQLLVAQKHSPAMMFGAGIAAGVLATVKACQATLTLEEVLAKHEDEKRNLHEIHSQNPQKYSAGEYTNDQRTLKIIVARDFAKLYAPAVGLGLVSVGLLTGAHVVLTKRNVALTAAYAAVDKAFKEYRARVVDEYGQEKDKELLFGKREKEIVEEGEHGHEVKTVSRFAGKSMYARIFDEYNEHWSPSTETVRLFLQCQQNYANNMLQARGYLFLNDVYELLGMEHSTAGQVVGWVVGNGDNFIDFGIFANGNATLLNDYMLGEEGAVLLDFNVDGVVHHLIEEVRSSRKTLRQR
jgi:hypothetical protein